jgi:hypothetical protein
VLRTLSRMMEMRLEENDRDIKTEFVVKNIQLMQDSQERLTPLENRRPCHPICKTII